MANGWRYVFGLPCKAYRVTNTAYSKLKYTACYKLFNFNTMNAYDKKTYEKDFPEHGYFNWKTVKLKTPTKPYYDGHKIIGVVLHDGNFMTNGVLFLENQYEIIDEDPLKLNCL